MILFFIGFAILHLIHRPEVQRKMQTEMDSVCGDSLPSLNHRAKYVQTFINLEL